jgi:hypothetical protein
VAIQHQTLNLSAVAKPLLRRHGELKGKVSLRAQRIIEYESFQNRRKVLKLAGRLASAIERAKSQSKLQHEQELEQMYHVQRSNTKSLKTLHTKPRCTHTRSLSQTSLSQQSGPTTSKRLKSKSRGRLAAQVLVTGADAEEADEIEQLSKYYFWMKHLESVEGQIGALVEQGSSEMAKDAFNMTRDRVAISRLCSDIEYLM